MTPVPLCACGCGNPTTVAYKTLQKLGWIKGEYRKFIPGHAQNGRKWDKSRLKHGYRTATTTFQTWKNMIRRCTDPDSRAYKWYGAHGITVCERWMTYANFIEDMGERPVGLSIDRIDNKKGYQSDNCRWTNQKEQMRNSSCARFLTFNGETKTYREWEDSIGLSHGLVHSRVKAGFSVEQCLFTGGLRWREYAK